LQLLQYCFAAINQPMIPIRARQAVAQPQQQTPDINTKQAEVPSDQMKRFVSAVLGSTEVVWGKIFAAAGRTYEPPTLVMFSGFTHSGCGSEDGPFYCPLDRKIYLDASFFRDLEYRFHGCDAGSKTCQFSQAYVIAHEVGHHVQNLLGIVSRGRSLEC
jgi:uncharacterized protein